MDHSEIVVGGSIAEYFRRLAGHAGFVAWINWTNREVMFLHDGEEPRINCHLWERL